MKKRYVVLVIIILAISCTNDVDSEVTVGWTKKLIVDSSIRDVLWIGVILVIINKLLE